ncbi:polysaccharide biosynthesis protein [Anaeromyxobacter diazotrophicus]|uniref:Polysaccharide biosynthesis protein n=1 Tax=Anaeromyxobacter diazotrophicus TaxID=2590199 RepID=A0A7I9VH07_9BACT|nr:polysaccharide biosynthesis protein [Anaeromyxobacter diazotrophicus]
MRYPSMLAFDALATACAFAAALAIRFDSHVPGWVAAQTRVAVPLLILVRLSVTAATRLYRWSFRMSGLAEGVRVVSATAAGTGLFVVALHQVAPPGLPRSIYVLEFFLSASLMGGVRFIPRFAMAWLDEQYRRGSNGALRTIIVGAGGAADLLARDILRSRESRYDLIGYVDDAKTKLGLSLNGKPVLGTIAELPRLIAERGVSMVLLAITHLPAARLREILRMCESSKASFKIIPASFAQMDERISAAILHDLSPEDLLPRDAIAFDDREIRKLVSGRRAMVTGAGGSIGGEISRQLAMNGVSELVLVDMNENELYLKTRRLQEDCPELRVHAEVADIREPDRLGRLGERYRPQLVFHAAAHKHVPLMEDAPEEAVKNNVFGTMNVARMAIACGAERLVFISTDKAVRPTSVMGATKRIAEFVIRDLDRASKTKMTAVRFGNVLGSAGSVVPIFKQQIERGGPVTVTHPDCTRYFMTIPEAVGLVLLAGLGGYGDLCVLDMGEPIKIAQLARNLITMAGYVPGQDIPIVFSGLRPGEKLYEELLTEEEEETSEVRNRILVARSPAPPSDLPERLKELRASASTGDRDGVLDAIRRVVPTYTGGRSTRPAPVSKIPSRNEDVDLNVVEFRPAQQARS